MQIEPAAFAARAPRFRAFAIAACALCLSACASVPRPTQAFTSAREALQLFGLTRAEVQALRAEARVDQRGDGSRIKGTVLMFVQRPGRVRFDAMTQFGPAAVLTSDGVHFEYSDLRKNRFMYGRTCPRNLSRLLNMPLTVGQTTELLLGGTPLLSHARAAIGWHPDGYYLVKVRNDEGMRQEIELGIGEHDADVPKTRQSLRLLRSEVYDARGRTVWRITYDDYRNTERGTYRVPMPFYVRVEQPSAGRDTVIRFKDIALDPKIPAGVFVQMPKPGLTLEEASCDD